MVDTSRWFESAVDPASVRSSLRRLIPEFASGQMTLLGVEVKRLRSAEPEGHWTATYLLLVEDPVGGRRTLSTHGLLVPPLAAAPDPTSGVPLGTDGWRWFDDELRLELRAVVTDSALPALALLTDPDEARELLERILREGEGHLGAIRLAGVEPRVVEHKVGVRCTVLCELRYPPNATPQERGPDMIVAKVQEPDEAARIHATMRALWDSPLSRSEHVRIARPLAIVPELGLLVQSAVAEEQNLKELLRSALSSESVDQQARLEAALRQTARGLADLHRCGVRHGESVTWSEELASMRKKQAKLADVMPRVAELDAAVFGRLEAAALAAPPDPDVPVHHSFQPAQVLLSGDGISFIDFDKSCQSEAASDLASFTTKLRHASLNKAHATDDDDDVVLDDRTRRDRIAKADALRDVFLAEYARHADASPARIALWESLELFSLILSAAKKVKAGRVEDCAFLLDHHMRGHGL